MTLALELQIELPESESIMLPTQADFEHWISTALDKANHQDEVALTLRIVEEAEGRELNARWRGKDYATNVLSFPLKMPEYVGIPYIGDLVICAAVVAREATEQNKQAMAHWAHLTIHGLLHLLGYDHKTDAQADEMEALEVQIMTSLGYPDPYSLQEN